MFLVDSSNETSAFSLMSKVIWQTAFEGKNIFASAVQDPYAL
jgi:hypothetical protein